MGFFSRKFHRRIEPSLEQDARYLLHGEMSIEFIMALWDFKVANRTPFSEDHTFITLFILNFNIFS